MAKTTAVLVHYPEKELKQIDTLVGSGFYVSRSDALRAAMRDLLRRERGIIKSDKSGVELAREVRREMWGNYMCKAKGDEDRAIKLILKDLKKIKL